MASSAKKTLVIVESKTKAKTIQKYLGSGYCVEACYGHVRDLEAKTGAVDPEQGFAMRYVPVERNLRHVETIAKQLKRCDRLLLAPDPDREGEAIAWHLLTLLQERGVVSEEQVARVVFHEVTKKAIQQAIEHPRSISMDLVYAQQARRALDYLVGFTLSPLLWKKVRAGLSAGRVQSPALRMIATREQEIADFVSQEYWTIHADVGGDEVLETRLITYQGKKVEQFTLTDEAQATAACSDIEASAAGQLIVHAVQQKDRKRRPAPPFITSTLQQEASRKLRFSAQRTMQIAQQLYEGVELGEGPVGLITYMRTDSVHLASSAVEDIRNYITQQYGPESVPSQPNRYKTKTKNAQEAHEAIRPTSVQFVPEAIKGHLTDEQFKLYRLIWQRAVASQMIHALLLAVSIDLATQDRQHVFRVSGSQVVKPGFMAVYMETADDAQADPAEGRILPPFKEGQLVDVAAIRSKQHFTEPPPRYTEASLVKALEEYGIGRPSTYASIIQTLKAREYVELEQRRFKATDVAMVVNRFLTQYFTQYVDYDFTANLEDALDEISRGDQAWIPVLEEFWHPFKTLVHHIEDSVSRSDVTQEKLEEHCPKCGQGLSVRLGRRGRFVGCTGYPDCDYTRNLNESADDDAPEESPEGHCPKCDAALVYKQGRYGRFIGCSAYPKCRHIQPLTPPKETQVPCPVCDKALLIERRSRRGKTFYSCQRYPDCDYALWDMPIAGHCPMCTWPILSVKSTKRGTFKVCPQKDCDYSVSIQRGEEND